jgi:hypothetical protein
VEQSVHLPFKLLPRLWKEALPLSLYLEMSGQHVGFVVDKAALGQVFSQYFGFPCQSSFHQFLHHHNHPELAQ